MAKEGVRSCVARRATAVLAVAALGAGVAAGCGGETPPPEPVQTDATFPAHELWPGAASRAAARERRARAAAREAGRRAELRRLRASPTVPAALRRALLEGRLSRAEHDRMRRDYEAARAAVGRLEGARQAELAAVVASVEQLAAAGRLGPGRFAPAFEQLRRNTVAWTRDPMPAPGERRVAGPAVLQYYVGRGFQLHPLASWGRVNGLAHACLRARRDPRSACRRTTLRRDLDGLVALAAPRGGFLAWEYYFSYGGGQARRVALVAHHDDPAVQVADAGVVSAGVRIAAPLEHVAVDAQRAGHVAVGGQLVVLADVDQHRALAHRVAGGLGADALQAFARLGEHVVDGPARRHPAEPSPSRAAVPAARPCSDVMARPRGRGPRWAGAAARRRRPRRRPRGRACRR